MADSYKTLSDLTTINQAGLADIEVSDLLQDAPLLAALAAGPSSDGTTHKYTKETGAPVVGFRAPNAGRENSKSSDTLVTILLKILDASFTVDKAIADAHKKGKEAYLGKEGLRHLKAAFAGAEKQLLNGALSGVTNAAADGFVGLSDVLNAISHAMVISAGGDTADGCGSIYMIRTNDDGADCTLIGADMAGNGKFDIEISPSEVIRAQDGSGKHYPAYFTPISAWLGLQVGSAFSVARIANIDEATLVNDDLFFEGYELFPETRKPNLVVTTGKIREWLRKSRTATNPSGTPAPRVVTWEGLPVIATGSLTMTEDPLS